MGALTWLLMSTIGPWIAKAPAPEPATEASHTSLAVLPAGDRLVALLSGCRIVVIDPATGTVIAERSLGDSAPWKSGLSLGVGRSRDQVFATLTHRSSAATAVVRFDLANYSVHRIVVISDTIAYPRVVVGPRTGRLFVAADSGFRIAAIDPKSTSDIVRFSSGRDPAIYRVVPWFTIAPDETRLFVSYHGDASGVDWIDVRGTQFVACNETITGPLRNGCASAHGRVEPYRGGFIAATGGGLLVSDANGNETASFGSGLSSRNHFMEFALDSAGNRAYIIGPCVMDGGLGRVGLLAPGPIVATATVCGERVVLSADASTLAIASGSTITIVDAANVRVLRKLVVQALVVDLAFVGG